MLTKKQESVSTCSYGIVQANLTVVRLSLGRTTVKLRMYRSIKTAY